MEQVRMLEQVPIRHTVGRVERGTGQEEGLVAATSTSAPTVTRVETGLQASSTSNGLLVYHFLSLVAIH